VRMIDIFPA